MKIERWKIEVAPNEPDNCGLVTDPHGEWVLFDDHMSQVDTIMRDTVWAMKELYCYTGTANHSRPRIDAFLARPDVTEWRKREEGKK